MADVKIVIGAKDDASRVLDRVRGSLGSVQGVAGLVGTAMGFIGIASVGAFAAMVKGSIDSVDALNDVKDATGSTIENISALEDIAARTGTGMDTVTTALVKLNDVLKNAEPGSKQEATLKAIGLSAKELKDLDPAEALLRTATALSGFADDGKKARIVQELFGKSLKEVAPLLNDLAEKGKLVATVTTEQAAEAEKFNKELFNMQKNAADAGRYLTQDLVSGINRAAAAWRESGLLGAFQTLFTGDDQHKNNVALVEQTDAVMKLENEVAGLEAGLKRVEAAGATPDRRLLNQKLAQLKYLREELKTTMAYRQVLEGGAPEAPKPSAPDIPVVGKAAKAAKVGKTAAQKAAEEEQKFRMKMFADFAIEEDERVSAQGEAHAKAIAAIEKEHTNYLATIAKENDAQKSLNEHKQDEVQEIGLTADALGALRLSRLDATIALQEEAFAKADANNASLTELDLLAQRITLLKEARDLTARGQVKQAGADTEKEQKEASKTFAKELNTDLKGAFSAAFRDTSGDPLQAFGDALQNVVYTRIATAAAESLASSFTGAAIGGGGLGSLFAAVMSFDGGGYTGASPRAGGLDGKGGFLAMMHPQETVTDHAKGQSTGGAVTVVQNFTVGDVASVSMVRAAVANSEQRIAGAVARSRTYGGAL